MQGSPRIDELRQKFHENPRRYFAPLANEYRKAGDPEQAIAICRAHLAQQPGHMSGHVVYGQALYDARRPEEARTVFEKALTLDPDNAIVLRQLGDIAREKGDGAEAKHWYSRALDSDPADTEVAAYIAELTDTEVAEVDVIPGATAPTPVVDGEAVAPAVDEPSADALAEEAPADVEVPFAPVAQEPEMIPEPEAEPQTVPSSGASRDETISHEDEVAWRKTPPHEDSPFVTRTMAELYASQGYRAAALDVFRQLALHHPDDREIMDRIDELSREEPQQSPAVVQQPEPADPDFTFQELATETAFAQPAADASVEAPPDENVEPAEPEMAPQDPEKHFTEMELDPAGASPAESVDSLGDSWDTDAWAAGFAPEDTIDVEFADPDSGASAPAAETTSDEESQALAEQPTESASERVAEEPSPEPPAVMPEVAAEPEVHAQVTPKEEIQETAEVEAGEETEETAAREETEVPHLAEVRFDDDYASEPEAPADESTLVAYSPQLPEDEDLPHFAPRSPTVREFFATLGARRPPSAAAFTARAGVSGIPPQPADESPDLPLASDAFASMFANSPVSEEDSRAAFALSGALTASESSAAPVTTPSRPVPAQEASIPPVPATTEESEEDIRRFREWLDGLQES